MLIACIAHHPITDLEQRELLTALDDIADVDRVSELHGKQVASTAQFDKTLSELQQTVLQLRQAETEQQFAVLEMKRAAALLAQRTIISPIDGYVTKLIMAPGENAFEQAKIIK